MPTLQRNRLKTSRNGTDTENSSQTTRTPRVVGTSDTDGVSIDFRATPGYQDTQLTTDDLESDLVADGGSELEADVYRCGGCEAIFSEDAVCTSYIVEDTGEEMEYATGRCPDCGTPITNHRTAQTTATFDLSEGDR